MENQEGIVRCSVQHSFRLFFLEIDSTTIYRAQLEPNEVRWQSPMSQTPEWQSSYILRKYPHSITNLMFNSSQATKKLAFDPHWLVLLVIVPNLGGLSTDRPSLRLRAQSHAQNQSNHLCQPLDQWHMTTQTSHPQQPALTRHRNIFQIPQQPPSNQTALGYDFSVADECPKSPIARVGQVDQRKYLIKTPFTQ